MNVDRLIKRVCINKGLELTKSEFLEIKADVLKEPALHFGNVLDVIAESVDKFTTAYTEQQTNLYNTIFHTKSESNVECSVCKGSMEQVKLADGRNVDYCKKCKIAMPKKTEQ